LGATDCRCVHVIIGQHPLDSQNFISHAMGPLTKSFSYGKESTRFPTSSLPGDLLRLFFNDGQMVYRSHF
jgi:hypothetical protein